MKYAVLALILTQLIFISAYGASVPLESSLEEYPGGEGSTSDFSVQAFSHPLSGTRGQLRRDFNLGNSFFNTVWVSSPASTTLRDGLGPIYNAVSCSSCHFRDGRGRGLPETSGPVDTSLLFRLRLITATQEVIPHPAYGEQLQPQGVMGVPGEGTVQVKYITLTSKFNDGSWYQLLRPVYGFFNLNFGPLGENIIASPRVAPQMVGLGLVEAISEREILIQEDPYDSDGDGISGRANFVHSEEHQEMRLGRFGWKAGKSSLKEQNAAAFNGDIGITSSLFPKEECTPKQLDCIKHQSEEDISDARLEHVTTYTQLLSVPKRRNFESLKVKKGRSHFYKINCVSCHTPGYTTDSTHEVSSLRNQRIYPYSDFLLHDMGEGLADRRGDYRYEGNASTQEWRTPPLWGLGLIPTVNGHSRYLHDGRARNLEEAILWHGGEARKSLEDFLNLSKNERAELVEFLQSL
jgi:CxxC motif-containing protein (DUF1111 family)